MEGDQFKVLLAEDDKNLGTILASYLNAKGFFTTALRKRSGSI